jgi:hypothetical protein
MPLEASERPTHRQEGKVKNGEYLYTLDDTFQRRLELKETLEHTTASIKQQGFSPCFDEGTRTQP